LTVWKGLGYYSRARRLWEGAHFLLDQWAGKMPTEYDDLLLVPGIGKYTAGAIASIAFGQRVAAIDGNVLRVAAHLSRKYSIHCFKNYSGLQLPV